MDFFVANVDDVKFDIEVALDQQYGALPLPFPGMDSKFFNIKNLLVITKFSCRIYISGM